MNTMTERPQTSRRRPGKTPKGRQVDPRALEAVRALLGARPRRRDLLIEFLHLIQDRYNYISAPHLAALAEEMKLAQAEVYEVATFYAHFDVVKDGPPPPPVTVRICDSLSCAMAGAERLLAALPGRLGTDVRVLRAPCVGACDRAPVAAVGHVQVFNSSLEKIAAAVAEEAHAHPYKAVRLLPPIGPMAAMRCWQSCLTGVRQPGTISSSRSVTPACAALAAPASRPAANGLWFGRSLRPA